METPDQLDEELLLEQLAADPGIHQFFIRRRSDTGESVSAFYRCFFVAGQQRVVIHIPLVPPLSSVPQVEVQIVEHDQCRIRITEAQKFGVRIEIAWPTPPRQPVSAVASFLLLSDN